MLAPRGEEPEMVSDDGPQINIGDASIQQCFCCGKPVLSVLDDVYCSRFQLINIKCNFSDQNLFVNAGMPSGDIIVLSVTYPCF